MFGISNDIETCKLEVRMNISLLLVCIFVHSFIERKLFIVENHCFVIEHHVTEDV